MRPEIQVLRAACHSLIGLDGLTAEEREEVDSCAHDLIELAHSDRGPDDQPLAA